MKVIDVQQGSAEWLSARSRYRTASEAPAMMGEGKASRNELLRMKATGDEQEFSRWVKEVLFERGHEVEAKARRIAEDIVGEELYPVTGVCDEDYLLASFDGLTMGEDICWECKQWNEDKVASVGRGEIPREDFWQVIQQLVVSGADRCLYMVTDGTEEKCNYLWVELRQDYRSHLLEHWRQFDADLEAYSPREIIEPPTGSAPEDLPALRVEVTGMVTASNLEAFRDHALAVFSGINRELTTDAEFADAEKTVKWCAEVEKKLDAAKEQALAQTADIDALFRTIDQVKGEARAVRLELDKLVQSQKKAIRMEIMQAGNDALREHIASLTEGFPPGIKMNPEEAGANFPEAMKGKRTVTSLHDAVDTELARAKINADRISERIMANIVVFEEFRAGFRSLFPDLNILVRESPESFRAICKNRLAEYEEEERRREAAEVRGREETKSTQAEPKRETILSEDEERIIKAAFRPTDRQIIETLMRAYGKPDDVIVSWLLDMDLGDP